MSWSVLIVSQWPSSAIAAQIAEIMDEDSRPDFEEELPDEWVDYFDFIDGLPYPEEVDNSGHSLMLYFELASSEFYYKDDIMLALAKMGGQSIYAVLSEDQAVQYYCFNQNERVELIYENDLSSDSLTDPAIEKQLESFEISGEALEHIIELHQKNLLPVTT